MPRPIQAHGLRSKVYTPILLSIFRRKYVEGATTVTFTIEELRAELAAAGLKAANLPDLIYRMKARTVLPEEITNKGFRILEITGRGAYALIVAGSTLIDYPEKTEVIDVHDRTPHAVRRLLADDFGNTDEQGFLSVLRYNDVFSHFLRVQVFHLKGHVRKSVPGQGQVEVDDVHVALSGGLDDPLILIPVEAKAKDEPVNRVQIAMQVKYAQHAFPGLSIRPLTAKLFADGLVLLMEFNPSVIANDLKIRRHAYYRIVRQPLASGTSQRSGTIRTSARRARTSRGRGRPR